MNAMNEHSDAAEMLATVLARLDRLEECMGGERLKSRSRKSADDGYTPREVARYLRISPERVRTLIVKGELGAINMARIECGRPRYRVMPHHLRAFEEGRKAVVPETTRRRRTPPDIIEFFPRR
jgi:hypothetical protein